MFIYSWVSGFVLENDISHVYACVYELVIDSWPGKQQCACFCSECGWSSEAPHTVSPSWSLERYLQTISLWVHLAVYFSIITLLNLNFILYQILPGVRIIIANPETKGPLGDSHLGEVSSYCRIKGEVKIICGSLRLHMFLVCFVSLDLGSLCP